MGSKLSPKVRFNIQRKAAKTLARTLTKKGVHPVDMVGLVGLLGFDWNEIEQHFQMLVELPEKLVIISIAHTKRRWKAKMLREPKVEVSEGATITSLQP